MASILTAPAPQAAAAAGPVALYLPTGVSPEELFQAMGRLRKEAQDEIDRLLAFLDQLDGDPDLEPNGDDEPELGSVGGRRQLDQSTWAAGQDGEPSLGSIECHPAAPEGDYWPDRRRDGDGSQVAWSDSVTHDSEDEHDGREPDVDDELSGDENEPSLGSFDRLANQDHAYRQTASWRHANYDTEVQADVSAPRGATTNTRLSSPHRRRVAETTAASRKKTSEQPFYGARCPSYPNCGGGCGLGCTHEIEAANALAAPSVGSSRARGDTNA
ncbi:hypothetical protein [Bradyrhizobium viridifuturi]|uniref:hypothetical protein n=1 Tax=Bradyrhizobium viridifuturi TaxID=1654716 RepID=UPI000FE1438F|nr:hypothetical protein [Bradyrhizobium viridifuturi]